MKIVRSILAAVLTFLLCAMPAFALEKDTPSIRPHDLPDRKPAQLIQESEEEEPVDEWEADPDGSVLTMSGGVNYYFDQKETYYNLDMSTVVEIAHSQGIEGEYWVREDGCKMLGDYIMCAANLSVHPRGSLVESSLGTCIVCDTGGFAAYNPNQLDIAVNW